MIIILGCGISGLLAALACEDAKKDFVILTDSNLKPKAKGFQYLHYNCGLDLKRYNLKEQIIPYYDNKDFRKLIYSSKVYGNLDTPNSMDKILKQSANKVIYNMDEAIDLLWQKFQSKISVEYINGLQGIEMLAKRNDKVISTIPINHLVEGAQYVEGWLLIASTNQDTGNYVVYDLGIGNPVYRYGVLFNNLFFESRENLPITGMELIAIKKVVTLDKLPEIENVIFAGRYGRWDKSILSHDVYYNVKAILNE